MITVHHLNNSRSQRILWLLEELGLEYEIKKYQRDPKTMLAPPELKAVHPLGKSPVITDGDTVVVEISDTGHGIRKEDIKRIYDPFFTTKGIGRGTGLGLSVSYGILQEHGGAIFVDSAPGQGTTFQVALPPLRVAEAATR